MTFTWPLAAVCFCVTLAANQSFLNAQFVQIPQTTPQSIQKPIYSAALPMSSFRLDQYHSLDDIYAYIDSLALEYPSKVRVFSLTRTFEQRHVRAVEIVQNSSDSHYVWLDALTHAREWITGSTIVYIIDSILASGVRGIGARKNFIIIPVVNPDGYSYTWSTQRLWRKNRAPSSARAPNSKCVGADLNRNFDHAFNSGIGSSSDPCSLIYAGAHAFSELETRALGELMWSLRDRIKFYLTMHSYNQLWAAPYAYTHNRTASYARHMRVLRAIQRAVLQSDNVVYDVGPLGSSLYLGSGFGIDFAYDKCQIEHSYLVELRDKGARGFELPASEIVPTARETLAGLEAGLEAALRMARERFV